MATKKDDYAARRKQAIETERNNLQKQELRLRGEDEGKHYAMLYEYFQRTLHETLRVWGEEYVEYVLSEDCPSGYKTPHTYDYTLWKKFIGNELEKELKRRVAEVQSPIRASSLLSSRPKKRI